MAKLNIHLLFTQSLSSLCQSAKSREQAPNEPENNTLLTSARNAIQGFLFFNLICDR
jgi:hypothetical protein